MGYVFLVSADCKILVHPGQSPGDEIIKEAYPQDTPRISSDFSEVTVEAKPASSPSRRSKAFRR